MSNVAIRQALEVALSAMIPAIATEYENNSFKPEAGIAYQDARVMFGEPNNPEMGDNFKQEIGFFQILLKYPQGTGTALVNARAELIRTTFHRGAQFTSGGVTVTVERTPAVLPGYRDNDRWVVPVRIRFYANI